MKKDKNLLYTRFNSKFNDIIWFATLYRISNLNEGEFIKYEFKGGSDGSGMAYSSPEELQEFKSKYKDICE